jgi:hypothetical protein
MRRDQFKGAAHNSELKSFAGAGKTKKPNGIEFIHQNKWHRSQMASELGGEEYAKCMGERCILICIGSDSDPEQA